MSCLEIMPPGDLLRHHLEPVDGQRGTQQERGFQQDVPLGADRCHLVNPGQRLQRALHIRAARGSGGFTGNDDVPQRVKGLEPVDVLATDGGSEPVNAYGGSGLFHQMIEIAGGRNVLADLDTV